MKFGFLAIFVLLSLAGASPLEAASMPTLAETAGELARACRDPINEENGFSGMNVGLCYGTIRSFAAGMVLMARRHSTPLPFCIPEKVTNHQLTRVFMKWVEDHPESMHIHYSTGILTAYMEAFPCPPQQETPTQQQTPPRDFVDENIEWFRQRAGIDAEGFGFVAGLTLPLAPFVLLGSFLSARRKIQFRPLRVVASALLICLVTLIIVFSLRQLLLISSQERLTFQMLRDFLGPLILGVIIGQAIILKLHKSNTDVANSVFSLRDCFIAVLGICGFLFMVSAFVMS